MKAEVSTWRTSRSPRSPKASSHEPAFAHVRGHFAKSGMLCIILGKPGKTEANIQRQNLDQYLRPVHSSEDSCHASSMSVCLCLVACVCVHMCVRRVYDVAQAELHDEKQYKFYLDAAVRASVHQSRRTCRSASAVPRARCGCRTGPGALRAGGLPSLPLHPQSPVRTACGTHGRNR